MPKYTFTGNDISYTIPVDATEIIITSKMVYSEDGSNIFSADGTNITLDTKQEVTYDFSSTPATATRYTRGLDRIGDRLNNDAVLAFVGDSTTDGLGFNDDLNYNGLNSRFYAAAMLNWTPTRWKGYFSPISTSSPFMSGGFGSSIQNFVRKPLGVANPGTASDILTGIGGGHQFKAAPVFHFASNDSNTNWAFRTGYAMDGTDNTTPSDVLYDWEDVFKESGGDFQVFVNPGERYEYKFCHIRSQALTNGNDYNPNAQTPYTIPAGAAVINEPTMELKTGGNFPWSSTEPRTYVYDTVAAPADGVAYAWHTAEGTIRSDVNKSAIQSNNVNTQDGPGLNIYPPSGGTWGAAGNANGGVIIPVGTMVRRTEGTGLTIVDMGISGARSSDHASAYVDNTQSEYGYTDDALAAIFDEAQIDTIMITVGINDVTSGTADYTPAEHKAYVQGIINRYRAQHAASGVTRDFRAIVNIPPTWRPESAKRDQMETYREPILELADENEDVCVLDMQLWWYDEHGPYANYGGTAPVADALLLQNIGTVGTPFIDGTHPNPYGGQSFVQQVWTYLSTGTDDETPGPYVPPPSEPDLLASMVKTEDGSPALNEISGSWYTQSPGCYTVTNNVTPQVATATSVYPRLIAVNGQLVAQIAFGSGGKRDQFVSTHGDDMYVKITIDNNGSTYEGTSKSIAQLNALYGDPSAPGYTNGLDPQRADSETLLRVAIEPTEWVGGMPVPNSSDGYGSNLGWDVNMGVTIEILSPAE